MAMSNTEYHRRWRERHPEVARAVNRRYYHNHKEEIAAKAKLYRQTHPRVVKETERRKQLKKKFGITLEQYMEMLKRQKGKCAICLRPPGKYSLSVDHDHDTGTIRGLLCARCNRALALFWEDPKILRRSADYLEVTLK